MMKPLLSLLGLCTILSLVQCKKDTAIAPNEDFSLAVNKATQVAAEDARLEVAVTELSESRCPTDVDCTWQGQASVKVELRGGGQPVQTAALCLGACRNDTAAVVVNAVPYWLVLKAVTPYPAKNQSVLVRQMATLRLVPR